MSRIFKSIFIIALSLLLQNATSAFGDSPETPQAETKKLYKIGAGSPLEGYYYIGLKLCNYITKTNKDIQCEVVTTDSSSDCLKRMKKGELDFALVQSNLALDAYYAVGSFINAVQMNDLRQVLSLHDEFFTVLVKDDDKILVFSDIDGKKISNGPPLSDSSVTYNYLKSFYDFKQDPIDVELGHEKYASRFCQGKIDAILMMTGHPNALVSHIANSCNTEFVKIEEKKIDSLVSKNKAFKKVVLKGGKYPGISEDRVTVAVPAILVTMDATNKILIENFLAHLRGNVDDFKSSHPVLAELDNNHFEKNFVLPKFNEVKQEVKKEEVKEKSHH